MASNDVKTRSHGDVFDVELWYPDYDKPTTVELDIVSVRSVDSLRVTYDFVRDGWVVQQCRTDDEGNALEWAEVYFAKSWALQEVAGGK